METWDGGVLNCTVCYRATHFSTVDDRFCPGLSISVETYQREVGAGQWFLDLVEAIFDFLIYIKSHSPSVQYVQNRKIIILIVPGCLAGSHTHTDWLGEIGVFFKPRKIAGKS